MAAKKKNVANDAPSGATVGYESELWQMADTLCGSMYAAEHEYMVFGLIVLTYMSDTFEKQHAKLDAEQSNSANPEDRDEYRAQSIFWVPPEARWPHLKAQVRQNTIDHPLDDAMAGIERGSPATPKWCLAASTRRASRSSPAPEAGRAASSTRRAAWSSCWSR